MPLQSEAESLPLRRTWLAEAAPHHVTVMRASSLRVWLDFRVFGWRSSTVWVECSHLELGIDSTILLPVVFDRQPDTLACVSLSCRWPRVQSLTSVRSRASRRVVHRSAPRRFVRSPFHEVCCPTTLEEVDSDLHRVCLTRLCCVFRFSRPLDALFRPRPFQPSFVPVTSLGFDLQRFSPGGSPKHLTMFVPSLSLRQLAAA